jgi:ribosome-associated protein
MARKRGGERLTRGEKRAVGDRSQRLARELMTLTDAALERVPLEEHVRDAVVEARRVTSNITRRREERRLAGVLRDADLTAVDEAVGVQRDSSAQEAQRFKKSERWRAELIDEDDAAERFVAHADVDGEKLAELVRDARSERDTGKPRGAARALFRFVREALEG